MIIKKFSWLNENDTHLRWFLKTRPYVAMLILLIFSSILFTTINEQAVSARVGYSTIDFKIVKLGIDTHPVFYWVIVLLESTIVIFTVIFTIIRLNIRKRLLKEDLPNNTIGKSKLG